LQRFLEKPVLGDLWFPILLLGIMIDKAEVVKLVEGKLEENMFLIDVTVNKLNKINVFVDCFDGLTISQCVAISRHVEHSFDREKEDFELHVSSPGLTESFKVKEQFYKYKGREVEILNSTNIKYTGLLKDANEEEIVLETSTREKVEGHKKKQLIVKQHIFKYEEMKSAKAVISFK
jgi:ribosome maturation factor RimP